MGDTGKRLRKTAAKGVVLGAGLWWEERRSRRAQRQRAEQQAKAHFEAIVEHGSDLLAVTGEAGLVKCAARLGVR